VTDENVMPLYFERVTESLKGAGFQIFSHCIPAGEPSKCVDQLIALWEKMSLGQITRTDAVVALGGGVVGDLAGFAAATILRGIDFIQIPTTLLAQVDSSVGGKTAVDLSVGKNLVGAFWQPKAVLIDPRTLETLPNGTFRDGMAEVIKYGCIWDGIFLKYLSEHAKRSEIMEAIELVLYTCCDIKRHLVETDEHDAGLRKLLNFGHTLGHAYELAGQYKIWTHGQAVAAGMCMETRLGIQLGQTPPDALEPIEHLCASFGLPTSIPCSLEDYATAIGHDKKSSGLNITAVFLDHLGKAKLHDMPKSDYLLAVSKLISGKERKGKKSKS